MSAVAPPSVRLPPLPCSHGLVLVPCPKSTDGAKKRLQALAQSASPSALAKRHRFIPFEDVAAGAALRTLPAKVSFTLDDGAVVTLTSRLDSEELRGGASQRLVDLAKSMAPAAV